jgi:hypothetical protein
MRLRMLPAIVVQHGQRARGEVRVLDAVRMHLAETALAYGSSGVRPTTTPARGVARTAANSVATCCTSAPACVVHGPTTSTSGRLRPYRPLP